MTEYFGAYWSHLPTVSENEKRILAKIDRFSPEALMTSWLPPVPQGAEQIQAFFRGIFPPPQGHRKNGSMRADRLAELPLRENVPTASS